jgi:hypothetical protein
MKTSRELGVFHFGLQILGTSERSATLFWTTGRSTYNASQTPLGGRRFEEGPAMTTDNGMDLFNLVSLLFRAREGGGDERFQLCHRRGGDSGNSFSDWIVDGKGEN